MAFELNRLVRDNIRTLTPYSSARVEHVGDARIYLDANENAFGPPVGIRLNRYPDPLQASLKERIAAVNGVDPSQIFIGNGSDEAIDLLIRIFCRPGVDNILTCPPTYGMYEVAAGINDVAVKHARLDEGFGIDVPRVLTTIDPNTKIVFLCSPNNPTGNLLSHVSIRTIADAFDGIVVVDEAYIHYASRGSLVAELAARPNLVVLQTLSKAWGLAGLRVGLAFADADVIELLNKVKPPYNVSEAAQETALEALNDPRHLNETVKRTLAERKRLTEALSDLVCVERVYPSDANFLLVRVADARGLHRYLASKRIVVRDRSGLSGCEQCLRITVGTEQENDELILAIENYEKSLIH